jgi:hypothetical protein
VSEYGVVLCSKSGGSTFSATYDYEDEEDCNKAREGYYDLLEIGFHFINDIFGDILDAANIQRYDDCGDGDESFFPIGYC